MIWKLNFLVIFNVIIVIFVFNSSVDSTVTNSTTMRSTSNVNDGKMIHSNQPESEQNPDDNNSLNEIMKRRHDAIMNARRIGYHTLMNTFFYTLTLIPLLFTLARTFNTWPNG